MINAVDAGAPTDELSLADGDPRLFPYHVAVRKAPPNIDRIDLSERLELLVREGAIVGAARGYRAQRKAIEDAVEQHLASLSAKHPGLVEIAVSIGRSYRTGQLILRHNS